MCCVLCVVCCLLCCAVLDYVLCCKRESYVCGVPTGTVVGALSTYPAHNRTLPPHTIPAPLLLPLPLAQVPLIYKGSPANGNWELTMLEAMAGIAVFTENSTLLDHANLFWTQRVPS